MPKKEVRQFQHWLERDWTQQYGNRLDHLQRLETRLAEWLLPELEEQEQFFYWLMSDTLDAAKARQQLEGKALPNWILTLAEVSKSPETWRSVYEARQEAAYDALISHLRSPLSDEVNKLIGDALERLFAKHYPIKEVAA
jgi:hypothetical protein